MYSSKQAVKMVIFLYSLFEVGLAFSYHPRIAGESSACGDWVPYKGETCFKLINAKLTKEQAENACKDLAEEDAENIPKLLTVKTQEKQDFLEEYIFREPLLHTEDVWLGLELEDDTYKWNDGTKVQYTGGIDLRVLPDRRFKCAIMGLKPNHDDGHWFTENCRKTMTYVCEKNQPKLPGEFETSLAYLMAELDKLKNNPVPIGFTYVQLPKRDPPSSLWPQVEFEDVTAHYAGLFFRAEGGDAAPFGERQPDNTRRILRVIGSAGSSLETGANLEKGGMSNAVFVGTDTGKEEYGLSFYSSQNEIRPINTAVRIWERVK